MNTLFRIIQNLTTLSSQLAHTILFPNHPANPDITISSRSHIEGYFNEKPRWERFRRFVNRLFWYEDDHCRASFYRDKKNAKMFISYADKEDESIQ